MSIMFPICKALCLHQTVVFTVPFRRRITVIIVSVLQSMKLRLGEAEQFA